MGWIVTCLLLVLSIQQGCSTGYDGENRLSRTKRNSIYSRLSWGWGGSYTPYLEECPIGYLKKSDKKRKKRNSIWARFEKYSYRPYLEDNTNIADKCCFIIKNNRDETWILTDQKFYNREFKCSSACAYTKFDGENIVKSSEKCLEEFEYNTYSCCSQKDGAFCKTYNYYNYKRINNGACPQECKSIADCKKYPGNDWCHESAIEENKGDAPTDVEEVPGHCVAQLDKEEVEQTATMVPYALIEGSGRRKRSVWTACPQFMHWRFNCYQAVRYMLYYKKKNWSVAKNRNGDMIWRYFKDGCCKEFQSKCRDKKIFKTYEEFAKCPKRKK